MYCLNCIQHMQNSTFETGLSVSFFFTQLVLCSIHFTAFLYFVLIHTVTKRGPEGVVIICDRFMLKALIFPCNITNQIS